MDRTNQVVLMLIFVTLLGSLVGLLPSFHSSSQVQSNLPVQGRYVDGSGEIRRHQMYLSEIISQAEQAVVGMTVNPLIVKPDHAVFHNNRGLASTINASTDLTRKVKTQEIRARLNTSTEACTNVPQIGGNGAQPANGNGNVGVRFVDRMGNNMIQYMHARAQSNDQRQGLVSIPRQDRYAGQDFLKDFTNVIYRNFPGKIVEIKGNQAYCGGEYSQYYLMLMHYRALGKCLFSPIHRRGWAPKRGVVLKPQDVVIHHRDQTADGEPGSKHSTVTISYYVVILTRINYNKIYIIAASALHHSETIQTLKNRSSAEIYHGSPSEDLSLVIMSPTLIGTMGTFSWMTAYLNEGSSIHLPFYSNLESETDWLPWNQPFMHDDVRITYHDVAAPESITHETAAQVLTGETSFGKSVRARKDPCADAGLYNLSSSTS